MSSAAISRFDAKTVHAELDELAALPVGWNGYGAIEISPEIIALARHYADRLDGQAVATPQIVPMTGGRLQFEWNSAMNVALELEFETPTKMHYLLWHPAAGVLEEAAFPATEFEQALRLVDRYHQQEAVEARRREGDAEDADGSGSEL